MQKLKTQLRYYGELNKLAKNRIRKDIIIRYWDDMMRVAGSLKLGKVHPTQLLITIYSPSRMEFKFLIFSLFILSTPLILGCPNRRYLSNENKLAYDLLFTRM